MIDFIKNRFSFWGVAPLCNLNCEHGFYIGSFCFPLCTRCFAIILGLLVTVIILLFIKIKPKIPYIIWGIICIIPCFIDGVLQYLFYIESTNLRRFFLGSLSGVGIGFCFIYFIKTLENLQTKLKTKK